MNKLKTTNNGGFGFELDDFRFEQSAVREAFYGLLSAFGVSAEESFIISGCFVTDNTTNYSVAAGYIALEGEIYKVDAHTLVKTDGHTYYWGVVVSYDPSGAEVFENATTNDTYELRKVQLVSSASPPGSYMPMAAETIHDKIAAKLGKRFQEEEFNSSHFTLDAGTLSINEWDQHIYYRITGEMIMMMFTVSLCTWSGTAPRELRIYTPKAMVGLSGNYKFPKYLPCIVRDGSDYVRGVMVQISSGRWIFKKEDGSVWSNPEMGVFFQFFVPYYP